MLCVQRFNEIVFKSVLRDFYGNIIVEFCETGCDLTKK